MNSISKLKSKLIIKLSPNAPKFKESKSYNLVKILKKKIKTKKIYFQIKIISSKSEQFTILKF